MRMPGSPVFFDLATPITDLMPGTPSESGPALADLLTELVPVDPRADGFEFAPPADPSSDGNAPADIPPAAPPLPEAAAAAAAAHVPVAADISPAGTAVGFYHDPVAGKGDKGGKPGGKPGGNVPTTPVYDYTSGADDDATTDHFNVDLRFFGEGWTIDYLNAFAAAADFVSKMITQGLAADSYDGNAVDDVLIDVTLTNLGSIGGVLGQSTPTSVRSSDGQTPDGLTVTGEIQIDTNDVSGLSQLGTLDDLGLHEILHVLGLGTLWQAPTRGWVDVVTEPNLDTKNPNDTITTATYTGGTKDASGADPLVEPDGQYGHWMEAEYGDELMSTVVNPSGNFLSDMSLAALADLGYAVDMTANDAFQTAGTSIDLSADYTEDVFLIA